LVRRQEEHPVCKSDEVLAWLSVWSNDLHIVQLMPLPLYHLLLH